jgi:hypothetical protein
VQSPDRPSGAGRFCHGWAVVAAAFALLFTGFGVVYTFAAFFKAFQSEFGAVRPWFVRRCAARVGTRGWRFVGRAAARSYTAAMKQESGRQGAR